MKKLSFLLAALFLLIPQMSDAAFTRDLELGSVGQDVKELQQFLNNQGFTVSTSGPGSPGNETENFGPDTRRALIDFQSANNISPASGYFGPLTRRNIESISQTSQVSTSGNNDNVIVIYPPNEAEGADLSTKVENITISGSGLTSLNPFSYTVDTKDATLNVLAQGVNPGKFFIVQEGNAPVVFSRKSVGNNQVLLVLAVNTTRVGTYDFAFTIREGSSFGRILYDARDNKDNLKIFNNTNAIIQKVDLSSSETFLIPGNDRKLFKFSVTAPLTQNIEFSNAVFDIATYDGTNSSSFSINNFKLYGYSDASFSKTTYGASGLLNSGDLSTSDDQIIDNKVTIYFNPAAGSGSNKESIRVPAGTTRYFLLTADVSGTSIFSSATLSLKSLEGANESIRLSYETLVGDESYEDNESEDLNISGKVIYENGEGISGIGVYINNVNVAKTNSDGSFNIDASSLINPNLVKGALYKLSVDTPPDFDYVEAQNGRVKSTVYNWQALGLDCQNASNSSLCDETIKVLFSSSSSSDLSNYITQAKVNDLASDDNYVFVAKNIISTIVPGTTTSSQTSQDQTTTAQKEPLTSSEASTSKNTTSSSSVELADFNAYVLDDSGNGVSGVTVSLSTGHSVTTNSSGIASFNGDTTRIRKGAIIKISADIPSEYDYIRARDSREVNSSGVVNASSYNWQVIGVDCTNENSSCENAIGEVFGSKDHVSTASRYDINSDSFVFVLGKFPKEISGKVINEAGSGVPGITVTVNNSRSVITGNDGSFKFTPSDLGIVKGGSYAIRIIPSSGTRSQALIKTNTQNWDNSNCGADTTTPSGTCVLGTNYEDQILGESCMGSTGGVCINHSYKRDLPSDTDFLFRLKSTTGASAIESGNLFSRWLGFLNKIF